MLPMRIMRGRRHLQGKEEWQQGLNPTGRHPGGLVGVS